jgi:hypothetical protein
MPVTVDELIATIGSATPAQRQQIRESIDSQRLLDRLKSETAALRKWAADGYNAVVVQIDAYQAQLDSGDTAAVQPTKNQLVTTFRGT